MGIGTAFVVGKPLQIIMAISIMRQMKFDAPLYLLVVYSFRGAPEVVEAFRADQDYTGIEVKFFGSHAGAFEFVRRNKISCLFVDTDVGVKNLINLASLKAKNRTLKINVYEEGFGSYRDDLYSGLKKVILPLCGVGVRFGGAVVTNAVFLLHPDQYQSIFSKNKKQLVKIEYGPMAMINQDFLFWRKIFSLDQSLFGGGNKCSLYLSDWNADIDRAGNFFDGDGDKYIKLHPHIKSAPKEFDRAVLVDGIAPAELVISELLDRYGSVKIYHHGSSVERYVSNDRVTFIRV